jgi:hypothetical protein
MQELPVSPRGRENSWPGVGSVSYLEPALLPTAFHERLAPRIASMLRARCACRIGVAAQADVKRQRPQASPG